MHRDLIRALLDDAGATSVLDAGCGPASLLRDLDGSDRALYGFDLTPEMVAAGRRAMAARGHPPTRVWEGSVTDPEAFRCPDEPAAGFEAALCCGVFPHIEEEHDAAVVEHLRDAVEPGGTVVIEARNALFALFTLNRYSWQLFRDDLMDVGQLRALARADDEEGLSLALGEIEARFRTDLPPLRRGREVEPGYDEVLSRTHHPHALADVARGAGLRDVRILYFHYHALPPMVEHHVPELARRAALAMEDPTDDRGLVMASAFLLTGRAP
ncbi:MAG: class I SAM-dependent methyltransferase [Miltoncostaeaceae bacterium]